VEAGRWGAEAIGCVSQSQYLLVLGCLGVLLAFYFSAVPAIEQLAHLGSPKSVRRALSAKLR
jgi:hypothetical protein